MTDQKPDLIAAATEIAAAYVSRNHVAAADLPALVTHLHATLTALVPKGGMAKIERDDETKPTQSQIRKSITSEGLISFIDGRPYQTLKRHLKGYGLDALSYRQKYGLPHDYPTVAPSYSERRAAIAKSRKFGKGSKGRPKKAK